MLNTEWIEVEVIELLVNDAAKLGFGIGGNKTTGIVVRHISPTGVAQLDGRLHLGDHILCIQEFNVRGFGPGQAAAILRHTISSNLTAAVNLHSEIAMRAALGKPSHIPLVGSIPVRFIVARPAHGTPEELASAYLEQQRRIAEEQLIAMLGIVPTENLEEHLETILNNSLPSVFMEPTMPQSYTAGVEEVSSYNGDSEHTIDLGLQSEQVIEVNFPVHQSHNSGLDTTLCGVDEQQSFTNSNDEGRDGNFRIDMEREICDRGQVVSIIHPVSPMVPLNMDNGDLTSSNHADMGAVETHVINLGHVAKYHSLGMNVVGYVYRDPEQDTQYQHGVFVKTISPDGIAAQNGLLKVHDQIVQVNQHTLLGLDNFNAVSLLRNEFGPVKLTIRRYKGGFIFNQLQQEALNKPKDRNWSGEPWMDQHSFNIRNTVKSITSCENLRPLRTLSGPMIIELTDDLDGLEPIVSTPSSWSKRLTDGSLAVGRGRFVKSHSCKFTKKHMGYGRDLYSGTEFSRQPPSAKQHLDESLAYSGPVTRELEELMRKVWEPLVGSDQQIIVLRFKKSSHVLELGMSLQGVDHIRQSTNAAGNIPNGLSPPNTPTASTVSRHFVRDIQPGGLIASLERIQSGDELLQVNGRRLRDTPLQSTIRCLRNLPKHIELVVARPVREEGGGVGDSYHLGFEYTNSEVGFVDNDEYVHEVHASEVNSVDSHYDPIDDQTAAAAAQSIVRLRHTDPNALRIAYDRTSDWIRHSSNVVAADSPSMSANLSQTAELTDVPQSSPSLDSDVHVGHRRKIGTSTLRRLRRDPRYGDKRPVWSHVPMLIQLSKTNSGFGFSLSEYEELTISNVEPQRRRISLTLGRLHSRKSDNRGSHVSDWPKPLSRSVSLPRSQSLRSPVAHKPGCLLVDSIVPNGVAAQDGRICVGDRLLFVNDRNLSKSSLKEAAAALRSAPNGPCLLGIAKMYLESNLSSELAPATLPAGLSDHTEPLYCDTGGREDKFDAGIGFVDDVGVTKDHPLDFNVLPSPNTLTANLHGPTLNVPPLDVEYEQSTQMLLLSDPIGIKLDALAVYGQDGCRIVQILLGGAVHRAGVLCVDDYVTEIDGRSMRRLTNMDAFKLIQQLSKESKPLNVFYFPANVVAAHRIHHISEKSMPENNPIKAIMDTVRIRRHLHEDFWGLELTGVNPLDQIAKSTRSTYVRDVVPGGPAARSCNLQPGDLIITLDDIDVTCLGSSQTIGLLRDRLRRGATELVLGVRYHDSAVDFDADDVNAGAYTTEVEADVEAVNMSSGLVDRNGSPSVADLMDVPEPLTEAETRDELNVLSRSFHSPTHDLIDSAEDEEDNYENRQAGIPPPVLAVDDGLSIDPASGGPISVFVPPPPPPRSSRTFLEQQPDRVFTEIVDQLPIMTGDPITTFTRPEQPDDQIVVLYFTLQTAGGPISNFDDLGISLTAASVPGSFVSSHTSGSLLVPVNDRLQCGDELVQVDRYNVSGQPNHVVQACLMHHIKQLRSSPLPSSSSQIPSLVLRVRRNPINALLLSPSCSPDHVYANSVVVRSLGGHSSMSTEGQARSATAPTTELLGSIAPVLNEPLDDFEIFNINLKRDATGYGIYIVDFDKDDRPGVFVSEITNGGAAAIQGQLRPQDRILAINGEVQTVYDDTLQLMRKVGPTVELTIARRKLSGIQQLPATSTISRISTVPIASSSPAPGSSSTPTAPKDRIIPGKEILITLIRKSNSPLGLAVVGGGDTALKNIIVHEIHGQSAAAVDGRLMVGDRILAVNNVDIRDANHQTAKELLQQAGDRVQLLIYRDPLFVGTAEIDEPEVVSVNLRRAPGKPFGLSLIGRAPYSTGTAIAAIIKDSPADLCHSLCTGDVILKINGLDLRLAQAQEVLDVLKKSTGDIKLEVERQPSSKKPCQPPHRPVYRTELYSVHLSIRPPTPHIGWSILELSPSSTDINHIAFGLIVREATEDELAAAGGRLVIDHITPGSPAFDAQIIKADDRLYSIDREPVDWLDANEVMSLLDRLPSCTLELGRLPFPPYPVYPEPASMAMMVVDSGLPSHFCDAIMPDVELPPNVREMGTLNEEEPSAPEPTTSMPVIQYTVAKLSLSADGDDKSSDSGTSLNSTERFQTLERAKHATAGFRIDWVYIPPHTKTSVLGLTLIMGPGISGPLVARIQPGSVAHQAGLHRGDRILGFDGNLTMSLGPLPHPHELVSRIEEAWKAHNNGDLLCLTVIRSSEKDVVNNVDEQVSEASSVHRTDSVPSPSSNSTNPEVEQLNGNPDVNWTTSSYLDSLKNAAEQFAHNVTPPPNIQPNGYSHAENPHSERLPSLNGEVVYGTDGVDSH